MLYKEFTNMDRTIGNAIDKINGNTGLSFIKFSFIVPPNTLEKICCRSLLTAICRSITFHFQPTIQYFEKYTDGLKIPYTATHFKGI